jgi:hypothetical protein
MCSGGIHKWRTSSLLKWAVLPGREVWASSSLQLARGFFVARAPEMIGSFPYIRVVVKLDWTKAYVAIRRSPRMPFFLNLRTVGRNPLPKPAFYSSEVI